MAKAECSLALRRAGKHYPRPCKLCKGKGCLKPLDPKDAKGKRDKDKGFGFWMAKPSTKGHNNSRKDRIHDVVLPDRDTDIVGPLDAGTSQRKRRKGAE